jgi:hypothetical protein
MSKLNNALITVLLIVISSCNIITWEYIDVSSSILAAQNYFIGEYVRIDFSIEPNKQDIEKNLQFNAGGKAANIGGYWNGSSFYIRPQTSWQKGELYSVTLEGSFLMADGRTYTINFFRKFIYGEEGEEFILTSYDMGSEYLELTFNRPVLITSFNERLTISPYFEKDIQFSNNNMMARIIPAGTFKINTIYAWSLSKLISHDGYLMQKQYAQVYHSPLDTTIPLIEKICPVTYEHGLIQWHTSQELDGNLIENQAIGFIFSKEMDEQSVRSGITLYPSVNGYFIRDTDFSFIFIPESNYQLKKNYRITLSDSIMDKAGISLYEEKVIYFTTINDYLEINSIVFDDYNNMSFADDINEYTIIGNRLGITINFSTMIPQKYRKRCVDSISLSVLFPDTAMFPTLLSTVWNEPGYQLKLTYQDFTSSTFAGIDNYYILEIKSGSNNVINNSEEYLEDDVCVIFISR